MEDIPPESLKEKLPELLKSVTGLNVTIPHKVPVIDFLDKLDDSALRYNSVNCICGKDGVLTGTISIATVFCVPYLKML